MQMGIHRLRHILILFTQTHIVNLSPVRGKSLKITIVHLIKTMFLYIMKKAYCIFQRLLIACGTREFGKSVDTEPQRINLLFCIHRISFIIKRPIDTSIVMVIKMLDDIITRTCRSLQILWFVYQSVRSRERPENTTVENGTFVSSHHQSIVTGHLTEIASIGLIGHPFYPKIQNIILQDIFH